MENCYLEQVFIIAEAGVNHNGDLKLALQLVEMAQESGADAIKFQTFNTDKLVSKISEMADYQKQNIGISETQYEMLKKLELSHLEFIKIKQYCDQKKITFLSTPDEEESLDFLVEELDVPIIKVGSGEITNLPYLERIARKNKPVILSTGMSTLQEVAEAVTIIQLNRKSSVKSEFPSLSLLHCTTNYPTPFAEVNLKAICTLKETFKLQVGYSDHTLGIEIPIAAVAMGAKIIEKHFTLDNNLPGPDHKASLNPIEFKAMVSAIRHLELAWGNGLKIPSPSELKNMEVVRKSLVAVKDLPMGHILNATDITVKRPGIGILPRFYDTIIGFSLTQEIKKDEPFQWAYFKEK